MNDDTLGYSFRFITLLDLCGVRGVSTSYLRIFENNIRFTPKEIFILRKRFQQWRQGTRRSRRNSWVPRPMHNIEEKPILLF